MSREQASETLHQDNVRDPCRTFRQTRDADAPHSEDVIESDASEDLLLISWKSHYSKVLTHVEDDESPANAEVPPSLAPVHVGGSKELIGGRERAVLALSGGGRVVQLSRGTGLKVVR